MKSAFRELLCALRGHGPRVMTATITMNGCKCKSCGAALPWLWDDKPTALGGSPQ